jgi:hypothetical protein
MTDLRAVILCYFNADWALVEQTLSLGPGLGDTSISDGAPVSWGVAGPFLGGPSVASLPRRAHTMPRASDARTPRGQLR